MIAKLYRMIENLIDFFAEEIEDRRTSESETITQSANKITSPPQGTSAPESLPTMVLD